jgi:hypothetical protein
MASAPEGGLLSPAHSIRLPIDCQHKLACIDAIHCKLFESKITLFDLQIGWERERGPRSPGPELQRFMTNPGTYVPGSLVDGATGRRSTFDTASGVA